MTKEEFVQRVKENMPDSIISQSSNQWRILKPNYWSIVHFDETSFCFFQFYFGNGKEQLSTNFIGEFEDWDLETIDKLCKNYKETYEKVMLQIKLFKERKALTRIDEDF